MARAAITIPQIKTKEEKMVRVIEAWFLVLNNGNTFNYYNLFSFKNL